MFSDAVCRELWQINYFFCIYNSMELLYNQFYRFYISINIVNTIEHMETLQSYISLSTLISMEAAYSDSKFSEEEICLPKADSVGKDKSENMRF